MLWFYFFEFGYAAIGVPPDVNVRFWPLRRRPGKLDRLLCRRRRFVFVGKYGLARCQATHCAAGDVWGLRTPAAGSQRRDACVWRRRSGCVHEARLFTDRVTTNRVQVEVEVAAMYVIRLGTKNRFELTARPLVEAA